MVLAKLVLVVAGTRPEAIKLSPVLKWLRNSNVNTIFVWSGQHYSYELSNIFFKELGLPEADANLRVKSGSHTLQTANVMLRLEKIIGKYEPSLVVAQGDTNTVAATALTAVKSCVPFAHVEAGLRSYDRTMPEEINRIIADLSSELLFAPTELAVTNLMHEGVPRRKIELTGNTIVDVVNEYRKVADESGQCLLEELDVRPKEYLLLTLHRQENIDVHNNLSSILRGISALSRKYKIIFPIHPRTKKELRELGMLTSLRKQPNLISIPPQGYFKFLGLMLNCSAVLTDSGGVQEEAFCLGVPTVTLRYNTERPETVLFGANILAGTKPRLIIKLTEAQLKKSIEIKDRSRKLSPFGKGDAGKRIAIIIQDALNKGIQVEMSDTRNDPYLVYCLLDPENLRGRAPKILRKSLNENVEIIGEYDSRGYSIAGRANRRSKPEKLLVRAPLGTAEKLRRIPKRVKTTSRSQSSHRGLP